MAECDEKQQNETEVRKKTPPEEAWEEDRTQETDSLQPKGVEAEEGEAATASAGAPAPPSLLSS